MRRASRPLRPGNWLGTSCVLREPLRRFPFRQMLRCGNGGHVVGVSASLLIHASRSLIASAGAAFWCPSVKRRRPHADHPTVLPMVKRACTFLERGDHQPSARRGWGAAFRRHVTLSPAAARLQAKTQQTAEAERAQSAVSRGTGKEHGQARRNDQPLAGARSNRDRCGATDGGQDQGPRT